MNRFHTPAPLAASSLLALSSLVLGALPLAGQSKNMQMLAQLRPSGSANDVWGYLDPTSGKEYALIGTTTGTFVYDCSNPRSPIQRGFFATPASGSRNQWRDMKTYSTYAYVVSEAHGGMQILDLSNPDAPTQVGVWGSSLWRNTHNIYIDTDEGMAYCCGTNSGMHIIDLKRNPRNPTRIATYGRPYIHDLHVQNGYAHLADIYGNNYVIIDVRNLPNTPELGRIRTTGSRYCHNTWASRDDQICLTTNEAARGPVSIYDISNMRAPRLLSTYRANASTAPQAIPHNAFVRDRVGFISHYTEGLHAIDLTNPSTPLYVGSYDTYAGASTGYNGNWGVYPFNDSGVMYVTDRSNGFFVVKPKAAVVRYGKPTTVAGNTPSIYGFGAPFVGNSRFAIEVEDAAASAGGVILLSGARGNTVLSGLTVNVSLTNAVSLPLTTNASGSARVPLAIPAMPSLSGGVFRAQAFVAATGGPLGLSASKGLEAEIFTR